MTRRDFLKKACSFCVGAGLSSIAFDLVSRNRAFAAKTDGGHLHEAMFYRKIDETTVQCELCPRKCTLMNGQRSFCRVREPRAGILYSMVYGKICAAHTDPIEKKPLFHFLPGTKAFSIATAGCNYRCKSCQNWQISQFPPEEVESEDVTPAEVVARAMASGAPTVSYTYTDPVIFYEYMLDIAKAAKAKGLRSMYHSNGSFNPKALDELTLYLDAANIDLKGFTQEFYADFAAGYLDATLATLKALVRDKVWVEITNLIVPTLNDDIPTIARMSSWIVANLGPDVPLHFSRFWPNHKLANLYPTPQETLEKARAAALGAGIRYVYIGNIPGHMAENTYCHACAKPIIRRNGYIVLENHVTGGVCGFCGARIPGVWR